MKFIVIIVWYVVPKYYIWSENSKVWTHFKLHLLKTSHNDSPLWANLWVILCTTLGNNNHQMLTFLGIEWSYQVLKQLTNHCLCDCFNIKVSSCQHRNSHYIDKKVLQLSQIYDENTFAQKDIFYIKTWLECILYTPVCTCILLVWWIC